jgi:hypothetical protein
MLALSSLKYVLRGISLLEAVEADPEAASIAGLGW